MKSMLRLIVLIGLFALISAVFPALGNPPGTESYNKNTAPQYGTCNHKDSKHALYFVGPSKLWPPNHKYVSGIQVIATSTATDETIDLASTGTHDQYDGDTEIDGSGHTADDITTDGASNSTSTVFANKSGTSPVTIPWKVRAERSGQLQDGRTYTITGKATYQDGDTCSGSWTIQVPHDMRPSNR